MKRYQTTAPIKSLAGGGVTLAAHRPVTPNAFSSALWEALLLEGLVVEVDAPATPDLSKLTVAQLKAMADEKGVSYASSTKKTVLIERLTNGD